MRALFVIDHPAIGWLVPVLRRLDDRGHEVHLAFKRVKLGESRGDVERLAAAGARITYGELPAIEGSDWGRLARRLRSGIDYLRYLEPRYRNAAKLRARARDRAPAGVVRLGRIAALAGAPGVVALRRLLQLAERCVEPPEVVERFLREHDPDVVLITPLVDFESRQPDYLRAAKRLGILTGFPVFSWDNLTNKGLLRDSPELVLVWNDLQAAEAEHLHRVPRERIRLTGAPSFDHWFDWRPSRSREAFCAEVGLRADRPIVLYVCSSRFVAPDEFGFIRSWVERLRAHGGLLAEAGFLVRPHPFNTDWHDAARELEGEQLRVWPPFGEVPHDETSYSNYFDSIHHAAAVVGINTTAQIESAIVGRPVHTVLAEEFRDTQEGTLHFHYLQADEFGHLHVGRSFDEHAAQLEESLRGRDDAERNERFLRRFVRPHGLDVPATELVVEAIEELAARPAPAPARGPLLAPLVRVALKPLARAAKRRAGRRRSARPEGAATPIGALRRSVHDLAGGTGTVVAGPWLADETGELLYWIPFLRWAQAATLGLRERLVVVRRAESAPWYAGIGTTHVDVAPAGPAVLLDAAAVAAAREALAAHDPALRIRRRLLDFALLEAPELPAGLELPADFAAVRIDTPGVPAAVAALAERLPLVVLDAPEPVRAELAELGARLVDGLDRAGLTAVLARSRGYVGSYGVEAYLAVLLGLPAVALDGALDGTAGVDRRLASAFLRRPPFGELHVVSPAEAGGRIESLLEGAPNAVRA